MKKTTLLASVLAGAGLIAVGAPLAQAAPHSPAKASPASDLPGGFLSASGSQIIDQNGTPVRIAAIGWFGQNGLDGNAPEPTPLGDTASNIAAMKTAGFNTVTIGWNDASLHDSDRDAYLAGIDDVVNAAGNAGMKVILNHHNDEGQAGNDPSKSCAAQQANGLWYDSGTGSDGKDGCGTNGTVTQDTFAADWQVFANRYAGNSTVIGFDLHNEPLAYQGMSTWGDGGATDIRQMYSNVGSSLEQIDPGVLIICEGPQDYSGTFAGPSGSTAPEGDLTRAQSDPVNLSVNGQSVGNKVVYSVHEYPHEISNIPNDSGPEAVARFNTAWGYLVSGNIAPVWIGESGSSMADNDGDWANTLSSYINGQQGGAGGPVFSGSQQGIGTTWWAWGYLPGEYPDGTLNGDGSLKQDQQAVYSQWQGSGH